MTVVHVCVAIGMILALIIWQRLEPVIALVIGTAYLGFATGLGATGTIDAIANGFGEIMTKVGLLIGFGVLIGSLVQSLGTLQDLAALLLRACGPRRLPDAMSATFALLFPSIYPDVQLVLAAPVARNAAPQLGKNGLPLMAGALSSGILVSLALAVPGLATMSVAGVLGAPLGQMLILGLIVAPLTAVLSFAIFRAVVNRGFWNAARDEYASAALIASESGVAAARTESGGAVAVEVARSSLKVRLLPVVVPLVLVASSSVAQTAGLGTSVTQFMGTPEFALFIGLVGAYIMVRRSLGADATGEVVARGLSTTGQILLITGVGGSLGTVIGDTDLGDVLQGLFTAGAGASIAVTILVAWFIAVVLHVAIGSITVAAILAAGIMTPVLSSIDVSPAVIGLAVGAGSLFALHVNSNFFWMFQSLLGISTRGALKSLTFVSVLSSVVALPMIVILGYLVR